MKTIFLLIPLFLVSAPRSLCQSTDTLNAEAPSTEMLSTEAPSTETMHTETQNSDLHEIRALQINLSDATMPVASELSTRDSIFSPAIRLSYKQLILPTIFIGVDITAVSLGLLRKADHKLRDKFEKLNRGNLDLDQTSQYVPAAAVYALNVRLKPGEHNFRDRTIVLATASLVMVTMTTCLKYAMRRRGPDGEIRSCPSGRAAMAFMGAEFLRQEYNDVSPLIGVAGYIVAASTGALGMYNDKHWLTDVLIGAEIGVFSTRIAYWMLPATKRLFVRKKKNIQVMAFPQASSKSVGMGCLVMF